jgi:hypothetical protein
MTPSRANAPQAKGGAWRFSAVCMTAALLAGSSFFAAAAQSATVLEQTATSMQPGEWREITTNNMTPTLDNLDGASGVMTVYTDDMVWDPIGRRAFTIGADHLAPQGPQFVSYTANNNTWQRLTRPTWLSSITFFHGYDHSAINQTGRILYHRPFGQNVS